MWSIKEMKMRGRQAFKGNYWRSVLAAFLVALLGGGYTLVSSGQASGTANGEGLPFDALPEDVMRRVSLAILGTVAVTTVIALLLRIFVFNPLQVGCYRFFRKNAENTETDLGAIGEGFGAYGHVFVTLLLRDVFLFLWSLLLVVPGIVKSYAYRMTPYILKDEPELSATEAITRSRQMMNGNKWRAFVMDLSFLGWFLLGAITCGLVGLFWTNPYYENACAALYLELKAENEEARKLEASPET